MLLLISIALFWTKSIPIYLKAIIAFGVSAASGYWGWRRELSNSVVLGFDPADSPFHSVAITFAGMLIVGALTLAVRWVYGQLSQQN